MSALEEAKAIVAACNAYILNNLQDDEGVFSYSINGRVFTGRSLAEVKGIRDEYSRIAATLSGRRRTYARFTG